MEKHDGQLVEKALRRNSYNISEVAKLLNVNRRSLYNWFCQSRLKAEVIYKLDAVLGYNFSVDFPELFTLNELDRFPGNKTSNGDAAPERQILWKDKYISLLEEYNDMLTKGYPVSEGQQQKISA